MRKVIEQRTCLKLCFHNVISAAKAFEMLQKSFKDDSLSKTRVFYAYKKFKDDREFVVEDPRPGRPSAWINDQDINKDRELVLFDRRLTIRHILEQFRYHFVPVKKF